MYYPNASKHNCVSYLTAADKAEVCVLSLKITKGISICFNYNAIEMECQEENMLT